MGKRFAFVFFFLLLWTIQIVSALMWLTWGNKKINRKSGLYCKSTAETPVFPWRLECPRRHLRWYLYVKMSSLFWTRINSILAKRNKKVCPIHLPYSLTILWNRIPGVTASGMLIALDTSLQHWLWSFCKGQDTITESSAYSTLEKAPERRIILYTIAMTF